MCLRIGTSFLLDIGLATCAYQIDCARFGIGSGCAAIPKHYSISKRTQIRAIAHPVGVAGALQTFNESTPTDHRLSGIQPHGRCNANQHWAYIFYHKYDEHWTRFIAMVSTVEWARNGETDTHILIPLQHPCVEVVIFIKQAAQETDGWQNEQAAEESNANH